MNKLQQRADATLEKAAVLIGKAGLLLSRDPKTALPIEFGRISQAITEAREALNG